MITDQQKLNNIFLGSYRLSLYGKPYFVRRASPEWLLRADDLEKNFLEQFIDDGLLYEADYQYFLVSRELWTPNNETKLKSLTSDIEELKVTMFNAGFNTKEMEKARKVLRLATADTEKLWAKKYAYSFLSAQSNALLEKMKFLFAGSIFTSKGKPLISSLSRYRCFPCPILDYAIHQYKGQRADDKDIRRFSRTEPWRGYWACRKATGKLFDLAAVNLNDEQRAIIMWSTTYDSIYEHPNCPPPDIIEDDDLLDGWLIIQKREREKSLGANQADSMIKNENIRNSGEIFIPATAAKDAAKIDALNDDNSARVKRQRLAYVQQKGVVSEAEMPDSKLAIERLANEKFKQAIGK